MKQKDIKNEVNSIGARKHQLGLRCSSTLKFKLTEEAKIQGITLSHHVEKILDNKDLVIMEKDDAIKTSEKLKAQMQSMEIESKKVKNQCAIELEKANAEKYNQTLKITSELNLMKEKKIQSTESNLGIWIMFFLFMFIAIGILYQLSKRENLA